MREILHADVTAAAAALMSVPEVARMAALDEMFLRAGAADAYRRRFGRLHPFWGNGSLYDAALRAGAKRQPRLSDDRYIDCLYLVIGALVERRHKNR